MTAPPIPASAYRCIIVTDGNRRPIGSIITRGDEFEALTALDGSLGLYPTADAAARELWRSDRTGVTSLGTAAAHVASHTEATA